MEKRGGPGHCYEIMVVYSCLCTFSFLLILLISFSPVQGGSSGVISSEAHNFQPHISSFYQELTQVLYFSSFIIHDKGMHLNYIIYTHIQNLIYIFRCSWVFNLVSRVLICRSIRIPGLSWPPGTGSVPLLQDLSVCNPSACSLVPAVFPLVYRLIPPGWDSDVQK